MRSAATGWTAPGRGGEREETTKPYEFGDPFHLDLNRTLANALTREENAPRPRATRRSPGLALDPADFEVFRTEQLTRRRRSCWST